METLNIGLDLETIFQVKNLNTSTYSKGKLFLLVKKIMDLNYEMIELIIFSKASPSISPIVFDSLSFYDLNVNQVIFTGGESVLPYLKALEVDVYLSSNQADIDEAQKLGILSGYVSNKLSSSLYRIVFDHRLFMDSVTYFGLGKWIPLLGIIQKQFKENLFIELMTTPSYSVDRWIKELFLKAECKINAVCYIPSGKGEDLLVLYDVAIYFKGEKRKDLLPLQTSECILNIDF